MIGWDLERQQQDERKNDRATYESPASTSLPVVVAALFASTVGKAGATVRGRRCATLDAPRRARTRAPPGADRSAAPAEPNGATTPDVRQPERRLRKTLANLTGRGRIGEADVDAAMREIRLSLLEADVNFRVVQDFVARVRARAVGAEILESLTGRPAGRRDRPRGARRPPVGRRPDVPPAGQPGRRSRRRPPGLRQDHQCRQARAARRQARAPTAPRCRRPLPAGRRRPARDPRPVDRHPRLPRLPPEPPSSTSPAAAWRPLAARSATS